MKINTDGVLIGAIANHNDPKNILDIGTGTGVISLMLAQRFPDANIHAVEIDEQAAKTAERNFQQSPFNRRLTINNIAIEQYIHSEQFDLIISNPPFFVNDLKNEEVRKGIARHTHEQFFDDLIKKVSELLSSTGMFWFVLPVKQAEQLIDKGTQFGLHLNFQVSLHSDERKPAFRYIVGLGRSKVNLVKQQFYIYQSERIHTKAYLELLKPYFFKY